MSEYYSKCGTDCYTCPSYRENLLTDEDRQKCSDGWFKYHNFRISPEKLIVCDGCQPVSGNGTRYVNCIIRRCALHNSVENCAHCAEFACDVLTGRVLGEEWVDRLKEKVGVIPDEEYRIFVEPYVAIPRLADVRKSLTPSEIKEIKAIIINPRLEPFPDGLRSEIGFWSLYQVIQKINPPLRGLSYARSESLKASRKHMMKILWAFGLYGEFEDGETSLELDHKVYLAQRIHSSYDRVLSYFETLADFGVRCDVIPLVEGRWLTPTRALRRQGARETAPPWVMKMTIDEGIGGKEMLIALQQYTSVLDDSVGKSAYRKFARADMRVLD